ncbi:hypothetical protein SH611_21830 [Geminicoccaceae bacterium 1502E]|nr:hypothetical protein [Geminicoccaceae bacterium 1502E]
MSPTVLAWQEGLASADLVLVEHPPEAPSPLSGGVVQEGPALVMEELLSCGELCPGLPRAVARPAITTAAAAPFGPLLPEPLLPAELLAA